MAQGVNETIAPNRQNDAQQLSPLVLAYIGDAYYEMVVRTYVVSEGNMQVEKLHKKVTGIVKASSQAAIARYYIDTDEFTDDELAVFKRGRNSKSHTMPKNAEPADYRRATGLEAVIGYLYLEGQNKRAEELILRGIEYLAETDAKDQG